MDTAPPARLSLPPFGIGCGSLANADGEASFRAMVERALGRGVRYFDSAALYLGGESERRLGNALAGATGRDVAVSTKLGRRQNHTGSSIDGGARLSVFDYGADEAMRSVEESLRRLRRDRLDLVMIHDLSRYIHGERYGARIEEAMNGAYRALLKLRQDGTVVAIGVASMEWQSCLDLVRLGDFDAVMPAGQYSLLHRDCTPLLDHCRGNGIAVVAASPFNSGILATGAVSGAFHNMQPASPAVMARVARIEAICRRHGVPLAAAALQFPRRHAAVTSVVVGSRSAGELDGNLDLLAIDIPAALWAELDEEGARYADAGGVAAI